MHMNYTLLLIQWSGIHIVCDYLLLRRRNFSRLPLKDRSVSTESPKPDHVLSSNARYEAILVSRSGSPDSWFCCDRVRLCVCLSRKMVHLLPQHTEGEEDPLPDAALSKGRDPETLKIFQLLYCEYPDILLSCLRRKPAPRVHSSFREL